MSDTVRYCVHCGAAIGNAPACESEDCNGLPNYYQHVPGPNSPVRRRARGRRPGASQRPAMQQDVRTVLHAADDRQTVPAPVQPVAVLRSVRDSRERHRVFPGTTLIGARPPARVIVAHPEVSSRHATLHCRQVGEDWQLVLTDSSSTNGTFVNDTPIDERALKHGDVVRFASAAYEVLFLDREAEPRVTVVRI